MPVRRKTIHRANSDTHCTGDKVKARHQQASEKEQDLSQLSGGHRQCQICGCRRAIPRSPFPNAGAHNVGLQGKTGVRPRVTFCDNPWAHVAASHLRAGEGRLLRCPREPAREIGERRQHNPDLFLASINISVLRHAIRTG
jgi:hypothetical protein